MSSLSIGDTAPDFDLPDQNGNTLKLSQFQGKNVVLYFYPRAMTPGCTVQACALRDDMDNLKKADAVILGVSPDKPSSLKKFEEKESLNFSLLSDESHEVCETYGAWQEKSMYGKKYMGVARMTYIISSEGVISHVIPKVTPKTHANDVLKHLNELNT